MPLRLAFLGIDHPHGAHWRQMLGNFPGDVEIVAFVPSFGGGTASLEERYAGLPRFDSVSALQAGLTLIAMLVVALAAATRAVERREYVLEQ